jgi:RNA polymerase sigma-70 factor (ECF subfamily)
MTDGEHESDAVALPDQEEKFDGALAREALLQIDPVFRAPLVLFYLQDHSYREIADILKAPLGTVMSRISRGRAMLREVLRDRGRSAAAAPIPTVSDVR